MTGEGFAPDCLLRQAVCSEPAVSLEVPESRLFRPLLQCSDTASPQLESRIAQVRPVSLRSPSRQSVFRRDKSTTQTRLLAIPPYHGPSGPVNIPPPNNIFAHSPIS